MSHQNPKRMTCDCTMGKTYESSGPWMSHVIWEWNVPEYNRSSGAWQVTWCYSRTVLTRSRDNGCQETAFGDIMLLRSRDWKAVKKARKTVTQGRVLSGLQEIVVM
jgi:hypothetical protein